MDEWTNGQALRVGSCVKMPEISFSCERYLLWNLGLDYLYWILVWQAIIYLGGAGRDSAGTGPDWNGLKGWILDIGHHVRYSALNLNRITSLYITSHLIIPKVVVYLVQARLNTSIGNAVDQSCPASYGVSG